MFVDFAIQIKSSDHSKVKLNKSAVALAGMNSGALSINKDCLISPVKYSSLEVLVETT